MQHCELTETTEGVQKGVLVDNNNKDTKIRQDWDMTSHIIIHIEGRIRVELLPELLWGSYNNV